MAKAPSAKAVSPLTGLAVAAGPVIAVKIDATGPGRPQLNIDKADIVYVEEVEAGLTRLPAIYASAKPIVGYVRSVRLADPELLLQYGRITLAASADRRPRCAPCGRLACPAGSTTRMRRTTGATPSGRRATST